MATPQLPQAADVVADLVGRVATLEFQYGAIKKANTEQWSRTATLTTQLVELTDRVTNSERDHRIWLEGIETRLHNPRLQFMLAQAEQMNNRLGGIQVALGCIMTMNLQARLQHVEEGLLRMDDFAKQLRILHNKVRTTELATTATESLHEDRINNIEFVIEGIRRSRILGSWADCVGSTRSGAASSAADAVAPSTSAAADEEGAEEIEQQAEQEKIPLGGWLRKMQ